MITFFFDVGFKGVSIGDNDKKGALMLLEWKKESRNMNEHCVEFVLFGLSCFFCIEILLPRVKKLVARVV